MSKPPMPPSSLETVPPQTNKPSKFVVGWRGILAVVVVVLIAAYIVALNISPQIAKPARPTLPAQNGFPMLVAATAKVDIDEDVGDAISRKPKKAWTLKEKQAMVAKHRTAISETQNALRYPYYQENQMVTFDITFPYFAKFRNITRILTLAGNVAWEEGQQKQAVAYYLDGITIGRRVPRGSVLIARLVGIACEAIGRRNVWNHLDQMDESTAAYALAHLEALKSENVPYWETLKEEQYTILQGTNDAIQHPGKLKMDFSEKEDTGLQLYARLVPRVYIIDTLKGYVDKVIVQAKKPYIQDHGEIPIPKERFTQTLGSIFSAGRTSCVTNEAADALLRTALALRVYHIQNGKYPDKLSDLMKAKIIINQVPDDPYAMPGTPLQYKPQSDGNYLLYSIGPDGIDDNGKGIEGNNTTSAANRVVHADSKGDIVAGWYNY